MPKRGNISAGRRLPPGASPVGAARAHSANATNVVAFTALSEAQWETIRPTRTKWPNGTDWRREIDRIGRDCWEARAARAMWVKKLQGKNPPTQRKKIHKAWKLKCQSREALAGLLKDGLLDDDSLDPDLKSWEEKLLEEWLSDYDVWVRPFAGESDPIQARLEWELMRLWKRSGGKLGYSRKKESGRRAHTSRGAAARDDGQDYADAERPGTPYAPLVNFLTLTLNAILGKALKPSGIAKVIDRHRGRRQRHDPFLMYAMHVRINDLI
ncbi:hypothetical protein V1289_003133 [Bradyrhizobium sp. AZCC 2289]